MASARRRFLIDTDTASDDAVALLMALRHPGVDILAITVVAGNVPLDQAVQNALYVVELAGMSTPVHAGCAAPLARPLKTAQVVHGADGMGDIGLPLQGRTPAPGHAADVLVDLINAHPPGEITLVTLGPLTNVASALRRDPAIAGRLRALVMMGGTGDAVGNMSAVAEFNVWVDPEAAAIVFGSGAPITMVGWDVSRKYAIIGPQDAAALRALGALGELAVDIQSTLAAFTLSETAIAGFDLPDPIAMAVALEPDVATETRFLNVVVETQGEFTTGQTVVDHLGIAKRPQNVTVVLEASRDRFLSLLSDALADPSSVPGRKAPAAAPVEVPAGDTPALRALAASGLPFQVVRTVPARNAEESAALQGIDVGSLLRTIVVRRAADDYLFVLVPAGRRIEWPRLRSHLRVSRLSLPDKDEAKAVTGYERGAITPFGSTRRWPVIADASLAALERVAIGGGARGVNVHMAPADLVAALGAELVDVSVPEETPAAG